MEMTSYFDMPHDESKELCSEYCRLSRHCMYGKKEIGKDPERCFEYIKLEDYEWDAMQDHEPDDDYDWEGQEWE